MCWKGQCCKMGWQCCKSYVSNIIDCLPLDMTKHRHIANLGGLVEVCHWIQKREVQKRHVL